MASRFKLLSSALCLLIVMSVAGVIAQDEPVRTLTPGVSVTGTLGAENPVQVYTFAATAGESVRIEASTEAAIDLALVLTDATGETVAQALPGADGTSGFELPEVTLPETGTYYVIVTAVDGLPEEASDFELVLEVLSGAAVEFTEPGELLTATGLQVTLTWNSTANMDLEVRDPVGGALFFGNTATVPSGGELGPNVNSVCNAVTADAPTETASWAAGAIPTGSYEVLVYYQPLTDCPTTEPVTFTVNVTVDGTPLEPFEGTLLPNQVFIASFIVDEDGTATTGLNGVKVDPPTTENVTINNPAALTLNTPISNAITSQNWYQTYAFTGRANDVVSVSMNAESGNLDTLLMVLDPNGNVVGLNDDSAEGVTDSLIANLNLIVPGEYTVIASRYGQEIGGTQGSYTLTLTGAVDTAAGTQTATLPDLGDLPAGSVQVTLQWNTAADLQLLVRDPVGDSVFDDRPTIPSGGTLAEAGNVNCRPSDGTPLSYVYWPAGRLPNAGAYEIEVQYQNQCNDTRPVTFTLNVVANGQVVLSQTEPLLLDQRYVTSFTIDTTGQVVPGEGGLFGTRQRPDFASLQEGYLAEIENARLITPDQTLNGSIRLNRKFELYAFDAEAGQAVTIGMQGLNGTLDPVLFLISPNGDQIAQSDDASLETRDSLINEFTLPIDGRYIIIATHFGGRYGVTAGDYSLTMRLS